MNIFGKPTWFIVWITLASSTLAGLCVADDCTPIDREASINKVLKEHPGSKVLKVDERVDDKGCVELEIRVLIDGTVKAVVVSGG